MRWGIDLWDKFEDVAKYVNKGIEFCSRYELFLKKRCDIENLYAKELKKLIDQFNTETDMDESNSCSRCYSTMLSELRDVASQHELVAENIEGQVILKLGQIVRSLKDERKKCIVEKDRYHNDFQMSVKEMQKAKEKYERAVRSLEKARLEHQRLDNDETSTKIDVKNALNNVEKKKNVLDQLKNDYILQLDTTNTKKTLYYQTQLPQVFDMLQTLEIRRIDNLKGFIIDTVHLDLEVSPRIDRCHNQVLASASQIHAEKDTERCVHQYKTGFSVPEDYMFLNPESTSSIKLNGSNNHTNSSSTFINKTNGIISAQLANLSSTSHQQHSKRKEKFKTLSRFKKALNISGKTEASEWADLPPEQVKNKLADRISDIKNQIDKAEKSRGGAIKMHNTYLENQALGDSRQTEAEIENMNKKIEELKNDLNKYVAIYNNINTGMYNNFNTLQNQQGQNNSSYHQNQNSNQIINHIYQSPSQHSINSSNNNNNSIPGTPLSNHSKKNQVVNSNGEHYAVSSITHASSSQCVHESFDEDDNSYCYQSASSAAVKAQILKTQQQNQQYNQNQMQSNIQNHSGLVSKASIESGSDCNSYTKNKEIMYADSQYDQVDCVDNQYQICNDGQQSSSISDGFQVIGTALVKYDYKKGEITSAMDIDVNESLSILERDSGDGWTLAQRLNGERGYVPTKYIEIAYY